MMVVKVVIFTVAVWLASFAVANAASAEYIRRECWWQPYCGIPGPPVNQVCEYPTPHIFCQYYRCNTSGCWPAFWKWF